MPGMHLRRPSRPRVEPLESARAEAAASMSGIPVKAVNVIATMARSPVVQKGLGRFANQVLFKSNMDERLREIVILRMGWNCQAVYEFGQHTLVGRSVGLTADEIYSTTRPIGQGGWPAEERALLQMTDDLWADDCVSDQTWTELEAHFEPELIMEYVAAALCYRAVSGLLNTCGVELDDGVPGWPEAESAGP